MISVFFWIFAPQNVVFIIPERFLGLFLGTSVLRSFMPNYFLIMLYVHTTHFNTQLKQEDRCSRGSQKLSRGHDNVLRKSMPSPSASFCGFFANCSSSGIPNQLSFPTFLSTFLRGDLLVTFLILLRYLPKVETLRASNKVFEASCPRSPRFPTCSSQ